MEDKSIDNIWNTIDNFKIVCKRCDQKDQKHYTRIFIDWDIKGHVISCDECGAVEYFDTEGKSVSKEEVQNLKMKKKTKVLN